MEQFNYILKLIKLFKPCSYVERSVSVKDYLSAYENSQMLEYIQYIPEDDYINLTKDLVKEYSIDKKYYIKVLFDSFFFYIQNIEYYVIYIEWIEQVKNDFPQFQKHLTVIKNLISHFLYFERDISNKIYEIEENLDVNEFLNYFGITWFREKHVYFEDNDIIGEVSSKVEENLINSNFTLENIDVNVEFEGTKILLISAMFYNIARYAMYNYQNKRDEFFNIYFEKLDDIYNSYFNALKNKKIFPIAFYRMSSLISLYYNTRIKYLIDTKGKLDDDIKHTIDRYFDDMMFIKNNTIGSISSNTLHKIMMNFVEIVNYYNYINYSIEYLKTKEHEIIDFKDFYDNLISSIIFKKMGFSHKLLQYSNKYNLSAFGDTTSLKFELGVFISSSVLVDLESKQAESLNNIKSFQKLFENFYSIHSTNFSDFVRPSISPDYVWF